MTDIPRDRVCKDCGRRRLIQEFYCYRSGGRAYYRYQCKACFKVSVKLYKRSHPESDARYRAEHREEIRAKGKIWYVQNREYKKAATRRYALNRAMKRLGLE